LNIKSSWIAYEKMLFMMKPNARLKPFVAFPVKPDIAWYDKAYQQLINFLTKRFFFGIWAGLVFNEYVTCLYV
jgi:hypothetical protein